MVTPYLSFFGNCEEALKLYTSVFGGEIKMLSRYTDKMGGPALAGKVMHCEATVGNSVIASSDGGDPEEPMRHIDSICLMVHCTSRVEAEKCFDALAEGGQPLQRLTPHPPPDDGGMGALVRDKYGYKWILTASNEKK